MILADFLEDLCYTSRQNNVTLLQPSVILFGNKKETKHEKYCPKLSHLSLFDAFCPYFFVDFKAS